MKIYISFSIVMLLCSVLFSQNDTIDRSDYKWKMSIEQQDDKERIEANRNPIVKKIYDTLGCDYLEQHFYRNGNLYYQLPFKNGKENGLYEEYHPNGQLKYRTERKDGYSDECNFISFDRFGDTSSSSTCILYKGKNYYCVTSYFFGKLSGLIIYIGKPSNLIYNYNNMVAEFAFDREKNKWVKHDYHCRSVKYARKLLKLYLERTKEGH